MRSHEARTGATHAQADHDAPTRAAGRTTLSNQLAHDDEHEGAGAEPESIGAEDAHGSEGDGIESEPVKVDGGGGTAEAPDAEHGEGAGHGEHDGDAGATDAKGGESAGGGDHGHGGERDATQIAEDGFRDPAGELPHRVQLEDLFGMSFAGVRAYTGRHARQATRALGANAYTVGNRIAFASPNPSREIVAHELAHVVQHEAKPSAKVSGVDTSGEHEAEKVEAAVAAGKPVHSAFATQPHGHGHHHGFARGQSRAPNLKANPKFSLGMSFNPPSPKRNTVEKRFTRKLWSPKNPIEVPIGAVPGLNIIVDPSLTVSGTVGVGKGRTVRTHWGVDGGVGVGLSYGRSELASVNAKLNAGVHGGFTYAKSPHTWSLAGGFAIDTNFSFGVVIGKVVSHNFNFGHCDIGKLTGIDFVKGKLHTNEMGWEWGKQPQKFFGLIKNAIANAKKIAELPAKAAKKAWGAIKKSPGAIFHAAEGFKKFLDKIPDLTPWHGLLPF